MRGSADKMSFLKAKGWAILGACVWGPPVEFLLPSFLFVVVFWTFCTFPGLYAKGFSQALTTAPEAGRTGTAILIL